MGQAVDLAQFPDADLAGLARAAGCDGLTVRSLDDLSGLDAWLAERSRPLVLDVKVDPDVYGEWLAEAFRQ
jgi:thiamine pyrophosphate-dependent acetolactate synthase large subunit-like protein